MNEKKGYDRVVKTVFNGSIDTLNRIHSLIEHISQYRVNDHLIGMRENLGELLIESAGALNKAEFKKGWRDWNDINKMTLEVNDDGEIIFDEELKIKLIQFSAWLRLKLYKKEITMISQKDLRLGFDKIKQRYGI